VKYLLKIKRKRIEKINQEPVIRIDFLDFDKMSRLIRFLFDSSNSIDEYEIYESYSYFDDSEAGQVYECKGSSQEDFERMT
jgi:hypothetical protein